MDLRWMKLSKVIILKFWVITIGASISIKFFTLAAISFKNRETEIVEKGKLQLI